MTYKITLFEKKIYKCLQVSWYISVKCLLQSNNPDADDIYSVIRLV